MGSNLALILRSHERPEAAHRRHPTSGGRKSAFPHDSWLCAGIDVKVQSLPWMSANCPAPMKERHR